MLLKNLQIEIIYSNVLGGVMVKSSPVHSSDDECRALSAELLLNCTAAGKIKTAELLDRPARLSALTPTLTGYQLTVSKSC